jgi:hypothetical protein
MSSLKKLLPLGALALFITGCSSVTNLTPRNYARKPDNLYHFEMQLDSRQQSIRWDSIKAFVKIGKEEIPMERVHRMGNRWEATVPLPAAENIINYYYKLYFEFDDFGQRGKDTIISGTYKVELK